jgi:peptide/nickel transport system ATP-binding protein
MQARCALNPVMTIGAQLADAIDAHERMPASKVRERSVEVMRLVGIDPIHLASYPHQLSGGMRQRAMIAMALIFSPELVIMDEPTSALDVVAQRSLMLQIKDLQRRIGFAAVFVTHDMSLVSHFSDRLAVMYAGQVVEIGDTRGCSPTRSIPTRKASCSHSLRSRARSTARQGYPAAHPSCRECLRDAASIHAARP